MFHRLPHTGQPVPAQQHVLRTRNPARRRPQRLRPRGFRALPQRHERHAGLAPGREVPGDDDHHPARPAQHLRAGAGRDQHHLPRAVRVHEALSGARARGEDLGLPHQPAAQHEH